MPFLQIAPRPESPRGSDQRGCRRTFLISLYFHLSSSHFFFSRCWKSIGKGRCYSPRPGGSLPSTYVTGLQSGVRSSDFRDDPVLCQPVHLDCSSTVADCVEIRD